MVWSAKGPVTQEDPIGIAGGLNLYGYAGGDPINFSDPFGLCPPEDDEPCSWGQRLANWGAKEGGALGKLALNVGATLEAGLATANAAVGSSSTCEDGVCSGTVGFVGGPGAGLRGALAFEEAASVFTSSGAVHPEMIARSVPIIAGSQLKNPAVVSTLTQDGSRIAQWAKFRTPSFRTPSGSGQVHFYFNSTTGRANYLIDFKTIIGR